MKSSNFIFRLSEDDMEKLDKKAKAYGLTKATLLRKYINDAKVVSLSYEKTIKDLIVAMNKIGVNINQIAKRINEAGASKNDLLSLQVYQQELIKEVKEVVKNCNNENLTYEARQGENR